MGVHRVAHYPELTEEQMVAQGVLYRKIYNQFLDFAEPKALKDGIVSITEETYTEKQSDQIYGRIKVECVDGDKSASVFIYLDRRKDPHDTRAWHVQGSCGLVSPAIDLVTAVLEEKDITYA